MTDNPQFFTRSRHMTGQPNTVRKATTMTADDNTIELRTVVSGVLRHKWLLLGTTLTFAILAFLMVSNVAPKYTSRASVMLDPRTIQVLSSDNVVSDLTLNNPLLDSEVAVLRSNILLESVIRSFPEERLAAFDPVNQPVSTSTKIRRFLRSALGALTSQENRPRTVAEVDAESLRVKRLVGALKRSTQVWREGQSYLISVGVETEDPELSMLFANRIAETYINRQLEERIGAIEGATSFLSDRVEEMRKDVETAEARIEDFRTNQLAKLGLSATTIDQQLLALSGQLAVARADLAQAQARYDQITTVIEASGHEQAAELLTSQLVVSLRQQMTELVRSDAELATRFSDTHPERQRIRAELDSLNTNLAQEVRMIVATMENDVEVARIRERSIQNSVTEMETRSAEVSRANLEMRQLEREADAVRSNYEDMLNRLNETRSTERLQRADARLVERAGIPGAPSSPRVLLFTVFGAVLGLSVGLIFLFIQVVNRSGFGHSDQLTKATGYPVIGSLVRGTWRSTLEMMKSIRQSPYQMFPERLRQLRTTLAMRHDASTGGQCVVVTSSVANEGKTSTTLGLAYLEALSQKSCVVVDFDLRRSVMAKEFGYRAKTDLEGVLVKGRPVDEAIYKVPKLGFDMITLRQPAPQLVDQCSFSALEALVTQLKRRYDLVIIDTAPVLLVADTLRLTSLADNILFLVRQNSTRRRAVLDAARTFDDLGARSVSIVMTQVDAQAENENYGLRGEY